MEKEYKDGFLHGFYLDVLFIWGLLIVIKYYIA